MAFVEIKDIKKHFGCGENKVEALKGVTLSIDKGEMCVLLGPSGSGKSTLLNIIGAIETADDGYIAIDGEKTKLMSEKQHPADPDRTPDHDRAAQRPQDGPEQKCFGDRRLRQRQDAVLRQAQPHAMLSHV